MEAKSLGPRYGFHGTSHRYVSQRAAEMAGLAVILVVPVVGEFQHRRVAPAVLAGTDCS